MEQVSKSDKESLNAQKLSLIPPFWIWNNTGLSDFVFDTIQECDVSTRKVFYKHIVMW